MTPDDTPADDIPDDDILAAELALGLLDGAARADATRRMLADRAFARAVERWRDRFATLFAEIPEVVPGAGAERRATRAANDDRAAPWRWATATASAVAAGLLAVIVLRPVPPPPPPVPVVASAPAPTILAAAMASTPDGKGAPFPATYDATGGAVRVAGTVAVPAGRSAQLWVIAGKDAPRAIGLLGASGTSIVRLSPADRARVAAGATLAISIEPAGGSPTGAPTGPVVATGVLVTA